MERKIPGFINRIIWKRATEFSKEWNLIGNNFEKRDILQGNIGDCYFLTALLALTQYPYLIAEKFRTKNFNEEGYYEMIFFIDGEWQIVFIDDYLPYDPDQEQLVGVRPEYKELWAILLEKAWVKLNGGYTNTFGGLFSEAIAALTGFPTEIFKHYKLTNNPIEIINLYKSIEIGNKEGAIMACGTNSNGIGIDIFGLIPGHSYLIVYPKKWEERNLYLLKLKNPWGKNEWSGNWSNNSLSWTEETKSYFNYYNNNDDGTMWIDLNDFINYFDNTFICHLLYGALFKYFYFEYQNYFKSPVIFNLLLIRRATTSITILFKNWRFNRDLNNVTHPFCLLLSKYNENRRIEKVWIKWDCEDEINFVEILDEGYYCLWLYCPLNQIKGDPSFKYILQISSLSQYEIEFIGLDYDFSFIQYLVTDNFRITCQDKINSEENYLITSNEKLFKNGLYNTLIYNKTDNPMKLSVIDDGIKNCQVLPPYQGKYSFKMIIPPHENAAILGLRLTYDSGAFNLKFQSVIKTGGNKDWEIPYLNNNSERFANYLRINISSNSPSNNELKSKEYIFIEKDNLKSFPIFESNNFSGEDTLRQSLMLKENLSPETLINIYPYEFNLLFKKFPKSISPYIEKKWTKILKNNGIYIGQINTITGELEGRGIFIWKIGVKYIGYFHQNNLQGKGILLDKNNNLAYDGYFYANKKNGFGLHYYNNGEYYEGDFINDKMEGNGIFHYKNGDIWEGVYKNKKKNGVGIMIRKNGQVFLTEYENDNFMGSIQLGNNEINYINNLRKKDKENFLEFLKLNEFEQQNIVGTIKNSLLAASYLYNKKRALTASIKVYQ